MKPLYLSDHRLNNLLRGAQANDDAYVRNKTINNARRILNPHDASKFASFLCNENLDESYFGPAFPHEIHTIYCNLPRILVSVATECAIQSVRLRHHLPTLVAAAIHLGKINSSILSGELLAACDQCSAFLDEYGYSATLSRKAIYLHLLATTNEQNSDNEIIKEKRNHLLKLFLPKKPRRLYAQFVNLTIDICDKDSDCLETMRDHLRLLNESKITSKKFPLHYAMMRRTLFPTNYHSIVNSAALLYFSSSSAIDLLVDLATASYCQSQLHIALRVLFEENEFIQARQHLQPSSESLRMFLNLPHSQDAEQAAYRASAIFPEVRIFSQWRRAIDFEFGFRTEIQLPPEPLPEAIFSPRLRLVDLCSPPKLRMRTLSHFDNSSSNAFLRTVALLHRIRHGDQLSNLSAEQIRTLLSETIGLSRFLDKVELMEIRECSEGDDADVIVFLAMVMLNDREPNEDIAFEMRMAFQKVVMQYHNSDIIRFLDWLYKRTASLCPVVVDLCDITFLEKLYLINSTYEKVLSVRQEICRWTASTFGRKEYESIADRLALDSKVRRIREGIDETRIFVDVIRYKQWALDTLGP